MGGGMRRQEEVRWVTSELKEEAGDQEQSVYLRASSADSSVSDQLSKSVCLQLNSWLRGKVQQNTTKKNTKLKIKRSASLWFELKNINSNGLFSMKPWMLETWVLTCQPLIKLTFPPCRERSWRGFSRCLPDKMRFVGFFCNDVYYLMLLWEVKESLARKSNVCLILV